MPPPPPPHGHFFSKTETLVFDLDLYRWPLTLVQKKEFYKKGFYPKEYICKIWKLYHLPFKSYGQYKSFCGQTNEHADIQTGQKQYAHYLSMRGHKNKKFLEGTLSYFVQSTKYIHTFFLLLNNLVHLPFTSLWSETRTSWAFTATLHLAGVILSNRSRWKAYLIPFTVSLET